jgi:hypothetical protein
VDPSTLAANIASHGLLGVMLVIVGWDAWSKDRELKAEREARIADAKNYPDLNGIGVTPEWDGWAYDEFLRAGGE